MNSIKRHLVYLDLLYNCLNLTAEDTKTLSHYSGLPKELNEPYGFFSSVNHSELYFQGLRSIPSETHKLIVVNELAKKHDLEGVPGFYKSGQRWRLNLVGKGFLKPYRDEHNRIIGLFIFRNLNSKPYLLSSENLYKGTPAIQPLEQEEREVA